MVKLTLYNSLDFSLLFLPLLSTLYLAACCPGPVPLHYPQHSPISNPYSERNPLGDCGLQTGLCSNKGVRALFQHLYLVLRKRCFIVNDMKKKMVFIVSLIDSNILRIDFSASNHAALCQGRLPVSLP